MNVVVYKTHLIGHKLGSWDFTRLYEFGMDVEAARRDISSRG
jgi:ribosomal protein S19